MVPADSGNKSSPDGPHEASAPRARRVGRRWPRFRSSWLPLLAGVLVAAATLVLWRSLDVRSAIQTTEVVRSASRGIEREIEDRVASMIRALEHLREHGQASRWRSPEDWRSHARLTLGAFPSFEVVHWTDAEAERRAMVGAPDWEPETAQSLVTSPRFRRAVERATESGKPVMAGPFAEPQGALFQIVLPPPEPWAGYLAAAFSAERAFGSMTETVAPGYRLSVVSEDGELFADGPPVDDDLRRWEVTTALQLPGEAGRWRLHVAPGPDVLAAQRSGLPAVVLGAGLIIALLLTSTLRYGELAAARAEESEERVRQRTVELEEALARIQEENRERRRTESTLRRFLITLGHELRNPLGSIVTALEVLDLGAGDPAPNPEHGRRMHEIVRRQARHLARLVDDLLDISRIEQGKMSLRPARLDLVRLLREVADSHRAAVAAAELTLETELPAEPVWVEGDATRLVQVVGNLLSNSVKFTDPGGRIALALRREGGEVVAVVEDTGVGLEPKDLERIFEPFAQTDEAERRMSGGLGLGLPIVRGLVEAHGGRLETASDGLGRGARFTVRLPESEAPGDATVARMAGSTEGLPEGPALRILVIDDHRDSADGLAELLRVRGHEVEVVYDGRAGIEAASRTMPDVVISDLGLPDLDGYEVARSLRGNGATRSLRLVALSGYGDRAAVELAHEAGFDHHLSKPLDPTALGAVLQDSASRPGSPTAPGS